MRIRTYSVFHRISESMVLGMHPTIPLPPSKPCRPHLETGLNKHFNYNPNADMTLEQDAQTTVDALLARLREAIEIDPPATVVL